MGQTPYTTEFLEEAYMRLALIRWIDSLPRQELQAQYARLPEAKNRNEPAEEDEWAAFREKIIEPDDPHVSSSIDERASDPALLAAYEEMAADEEREAEALEWIEGTLGTLEL